MPHSAVPDHGYKAPLGLSGNTAARTQRGTVSSVVVAIAS